MQIILEFMDKGMKGLLTGDLSAFAIQKMETSIQTFMPEMEELQKKIAEIQDLSEFYSQNFVVS
jgi:hypothetical protein